MRGGEDGKRGRGWMKELRSTAKVQKGGSSERGGKGREMSEGDEGNIIQPVTVVQCVEVDPILWRQNHTHNPLHK